MTFDYQENVTTGQRDRQMDRKAEQSDPYVSLCFAGDIKIQVALLHITKKITKHVQVYVILLAFARQEHWQTAGLRGIINNK